VIRIINIAWFFCGYSIHISICMHLIFTSLWSVGECAFVYVDNTKVKSALKSRLLADFTVCTTRRWHDNCDWCVVRNFMRQTVSVLPSLERRTQYRCADRMSVDQNINSYNNNR